MKFGISSYSFHQAVSAGRMTTYDIVDTAASMGFDSIDFAVLLGEDPLPEMAQKLGRQAKDAGIYVKNYAVSADFLKNDVDAEIERVKREVDIAAVLGAATLRHDVTWGSPKDVNLRTFDQVVGRLADGCRAVTQYAQEKYGIKTMVENHGMFVQDSHRMERLVTQVHHDNFGLLLDMGNFLCVDEAPLHAVGLLAPLAFHVHAKDFFFKDASAPNPGEGWFETRSGNRLRGTILGHGIVPIEAALRLIKKAGYDDVVAIEFEGMERCEEAIPLCLQNLKRFCG